MTRDIIEMRIRQLIPIEQNAIDVYGDLMILIDDDDVQEIFKDLIRDKQRHLTMLGEILHLIQTEYVSHPTSPS